MGKLIAKYDFPLLCKFISKDFHFHDFLTDNEGIYSKLYDKVRWQITFVESKGSFSFLRSLILLFTTKDVSKALTTTKSPNALTPDNILDQKKQSSSQTS